MAVVALGAVRNTEWLRGLGPGRRRRGASPATPGCRAFDVNGIVTDDIFVAGDVARFPHPLYDYQFLVAGALGQRGRPGRDRGAQHDQRRSPTAARTCAVPAFWSTQFGVNIKSVGVPTFADEVVITQGSLAERRFVAVYGYQGRVIAAVTFDQAKWLEFYRGLIEQAAPFPPAFRHRRPAPPRLRPVPAEFPDPAVPTHGRHRRA